MTGGAWEGEGGAWAGRGGAAGGTCPESRRLSLKPESLWPGGPWWRHGVYGGGSDGWTCDWPCPWSSSQTHAVNGKDLRKLSPLAKHLTFSIHSIVVASLDFSNLEETCL